MKKTNTQRNLICHTVTGLAPGETIGIDLGDKVSRYCIINHEGLVIEVGSVRNQEASLRKQFQDVPPARVALEAGTQSAWISHLLTSFGHEVIVANPRKVPGISHNQRKNDRQDAETLARYARMDPVLLHPVLHRDEQQQLDLAAVRARDALVRSRTLLVNAARGLAKVHGRRLPYSVTGTFGRRAAACLTPELVMALRPLLEQIDQISAHIATYDELLERISEARYPETRYLRSVRGVGPVTALTFVLTLGQAERFECSRDVGAYLGLQPKQRQSGERDPQLGITKGGNRYLRKLLVQCAHYVMGHEGCDSRLRQWGLRLAERGGANAKKRAIVGVARKLAVLLHKLWVTRTYYQPFFQLNGAAAEAAAVN